MNKLLSAVIAAPLIGSVCYFIATPLVSDYIDDRVKAYIEDNPAQVYRAASKGIDILKEQEQIAKQRFIQSLKPTLENDVEDPSIGSDNPDISVVLFSDYNCGFCKKSHPEIQKLLQADDNVRVVIKEFPILGEMSQVAALSSLAINTLYPEKFVAFQDHLYSSNLRSIDEVFAIASSLGISTEELRAEIGKPVHQQKLAANLMLGEKLDINGTPAFVIDGEIYPGALSAEELIRIINEKRTAI